MRLILAGTMLATLGVGLFAQAETAPSIDWTGTGISGVMGVVLIFIVTKMVPDLHAKFIDQSKVYSESIATVVTKFTEMTEKSADRDHASQVATAEALRALCAQCAAHTATTK